MLLDTWLVCRRELSPRLRDPVWVAIDIAHPLFYVFLFGPLMAKFVQHTPGFPAGNMWTIFTPAMMMQVAITTSSFVGMGLLAEYRSGVVERFQATPMTATSHLLGKLLAVTLNVIVLASIVALVIVGVFGLRPGVFSLLTCLVIVALFAVCIGSCSYAVALGLKNEHSVSAIINAVVMPLLLLSGALVPITPVLAPQWLFILSRLNPVSYVMDASRASFRGDLSIETSGIGVAVLLVMTALSLWWGVRTFSKEVA
jgi:ABC-2 type transport system permease protein